MSAEIETIRRAAALMRERAEDASPGPWVGFAYPIDSDGEGGEVVVRDPDDFDVALMTSDQFDDCPHIASWHPVVALAVADWLEKVADDFAENTIIDRPDVGEYAPPAPDATWCDYCGGAIASPHYSASDQRCDCYRWPTALAVARAYLGDER